MQMRRYLAVVLLLGFVVTAVLLFRPSPGSGIVHAGKPLEYWEEQALREIPNGIYTNASAIAIQMRPETAAFWLQRLTAPVPLTYRFRQALMPYLPPIIRPRFRISGPSWIDRRNVAYFFLEHQSFTNSVPEFFRLCEAKDPILRMRGISLLNSLAYRGYYDPTPAYIILLGNALSDPDYNVRNTAFNAITHGSLATNAPPILRRGLANEMQLTRVRSACAIYTLTGDTTLLPLLTSATNSSDESIQLAARIGCDARR